jgi:hypothetical protein
MKCPGQDRRCWTGERVREIPCPECGVTVEIFRDESTGRCLRCGHKFAAPGANLGCAQWCSLANECLGYAPERQPQSGSAESALAARLIQRVEQVFSSSPGRIAHALRVFQFAKELVREEGGDPRVVLCASLLLATEGHEGGCPEATAAQPVTRFEAGPVESVLRDLGLDAATAARVRQIVASCHAGEDTESVESRIVLDSQRLAFLAVAPQTGSPAQEENLLVTDLRTETARAKARNLIRQ